MYTYLHRYMLKAVRTYPSQNIVPDRHVRCVLNEPTQVKLEDMLSSCIY
jgi:hypothetical protein